MLRYVRSGLPGMLEGRCPDLHQSRHPRLLCSPSFRTIALAAAKDSMLPGDARPFPSQSGIEIQPARSPPLRYVWCGRDGMFAGRFEDRHHASHSRALFSPSFRTTFRAAAKGSQAPCVHLRRSTTSVGTFLDGVFAPRWDIRPCRPRS